MRLISLLNHYQHFPGFVYEKARHCVHSQTIEISVRPRRGSRPVCSGCHKPAPGYDHLSLRRFEFVPLWGCMVVLLYRMRRVDCRTCGVRVEVVPWGIGKHQLTKAYMLFLAHWARKLSWQETAIVVSQHLGQGLPVGRVCRAVGAGAPATRTDPGDRRR
jgi:transposase